MNRKTSIIVVVALALSLCSLYLIAGSERIVSSNLFTPAVTASVFVFGVILATLIFIYIFNQEKKPSAVLWLIATGESAKMGFAVLFAATLSWSIAGAGAIIGAIVCFAILAASLKKTENIRSLRRAIIPCLAFALPLLYGALTI